MNWIFLQGHWVLCPPQPKAIVHFLGGAFVATAPHLSYERYLSSLAKAGYCVCAPPFLVQPDHGAIATSIAQSFRETHTTLCQHNPTLIQCPIFGIGHSLGAKLQLLLTCDHGLERAGNILLAFNNFSSERAIPLAPLINSFIPLDFSPSPALTLQTVKSNYQQPHTLVIRFTTDNLDESDSLNPLLKEKFPNTFMTQTLAGDHLTPLGQTLTESSFPNPFLELGQQLTQVRTVQLTRLEAITLKWLNYQLQQNSRL